MDICKLTKQWLEQNGYDGLCHPDYECGCQLSDLMPCGQPMTSCLAGYKTDAEKDDQEGFDFYIKPGKKPV